jgi:ADP-ribosyltransferase exoenzyme
MLALMKGAMTAAGFSAGQTSKAFGAKINKGQTKSVDLGAVLVDDVDKVLQGGNLREKMGMVYQARFDIATAINDLAKQDRRDLVGDEMFSDPMKQGVTSATQQGQPVSYAVLKRRQSVSDFKRKGTKKQTGLITPEGLEEENIGLSDREKRAAKEVGATKFFAGREFYAVDEGARKAEQEKLRAVVSGLSGSTDMYFHIAKHLKMDLPARQKLRLAALGQMLINQDHSYHEIMHVAKTQGEVPDYADELPMGYTTLAPLSHDQILGLTGLPDFPGDAQIRELGAVSKTGALPAAGPKSHSYPAVLQKITDYQTEPSPERLAAIVTAIDAFLVAKKPGKMSFKSTRDKYDNRKKALDEVKLQCARLVAQWQAMSQVPRVELAKLAKTSMTGGTDEDVARMTRLVSMESVQGDNWYAKNFRATQTDQGLDTANMHLDVAQQKQIMGIKDDKQLAKTMGDKTADPKAVDIRSNLQTDLDGFVNGNKLIIAVVKGEKQRRVLPIKDRGNLALVKEQQDIQSVLDEPRWQQSPEDFTNNIDTRVLDILTAPDPQDAVGKLLRRMENQPIPREMQAINAYAQPGFYVIMNKVLNKRANSSFMKTREGQQWWAAVPVEVKQLISLAVSAVKRMTPYEGGSAYRGSPGVGAGDVAKVLKLPLAKREETWKNEVGGSMHFNQFVSTSKRAQSSYIVKQNNYFAIHIDKCKTGVDISAFSNTLEEREVLFPPNTTFTVKNVEDKFKTNADPNNRYSDAVLADSKEPGRIKITLEEA